MAPLAMPEIRSLPKEEWAGEFMHENWPEMWEDPVPVRIMRHFHPRLRLAYFDYASMGPDFLRGKTGVRVMSYDLG